MALPCFFLLVLSLESLIIPTLTKMIQDPRLHRGRVRVPRRDSYEKRPLLSATIHPDIKRTLVSMSKRTGMSVSQVADEVLYTGLIEMQELDAQG